MTTKKKKNMRQKPATIINAMNIASDKVNDDHPSSTLECFYGENSLVEFMRLQSDFKRFNRT